MNIKASSKREQFSAIFKNINEAKRWMHKVNGPHDLTVRNPKDLYFRHSGITIGNVTLGHVEYATDVVVNIDDLEQSYIINLPLLGEQHMEYKRESFVSTPSVGAIISPNQPFSMSMSENCRKKMVRFPRLVVEEKLSRLLGRRISCPIAFDTQVSLDGPMQQWWKMVQNIQDILEPENSLCDLPEVWGNLENTLITSLLYTQHHNFSNELLDRREGRPSYLTRLESRLTEFVEQPLSLADLERMSGVSRERLYRDFQTYHGETPIAFFRNMRFENVRTRLMQARPSESVSSIAMDCGFQQMGHFSKEYKTRFSELPSETLRLHRTS
ncbi:AraC family transcriptional regulator [Oceanisphaera sp.]|uniref:AraC family transcriptional regulator n=1 Tax=Oceanisphaera sp. TaxID=1929979 RepID=UPI003A8E849A